MGNLAFEIHQMKTPEQLSQIVEAGGGIIIDASKYTTSELTQIASAAKGNNASVVIRNADKKTTEKLRQIALAGAGRVTFELA
jgi:hypothetical protein